MIWSEKYIQNYFYGDIQKLFQKPESPHGVKIVIFAKIGIFQLVAMVTSCHGNHISSC